MVAAYKTVKSGDPLDDSVLLGPLHSKNQIQIYEDGLKRAQEQGGKLLVGGKRIERPGNYVEPAIVEISHDAEIVQEELFVPILYVMKFSNLEDAIAKNNCVAQGLSSSLITRDIGNVF